MTYNLTINDIPDFLRDSELCKNIRSNDTFDVPIELIKKEIIINDCKDLIDYIKIFDYWMINTIPNKFYDWIFNNKDKVNMTLLNEKFVMNDLLKQIKIIINTSNDKICSIAALYGLIDLLKYTHKNGYIWNIKNICSNAAWNGYLE